MSDNPETVLSITEMAWLVGTTQEVVEIIIQHELITPVRQQPAPGFTPEQKDDIQKIVRLHFQLEVSWSSMSLVLELLRRIDELENNSAS